MVTKRRSRSYSMRLFCTIASVTGDILRIGAIEFLHSSSTLFHISIFCKLILGWITTGRKASGLRLRIHTAPRTTRMSMMSGRGSTGGPPEFLRTVLTSVK